MANTTFSGPVISKNGFINTGPGVTKAINSTGLGASWLTALTVNDSCWKNFNFTRRRWYLQVTKH
jgi:glycine cleavage system H lipoate-binding protein